MEFYPSISSTIPFKIESEKRNFVKSIQGLDGCIYAIPFNAPRVVKFDPRTKSIEEIGPNLTKYEQRFHYEDGLCMYKDGVMGDDGCIFCIPFGSKYFLKIDSLHSTVEVMNISLAGSRDDENSFCTYSCGALAKDGCIYYMPSTNADCILKLDPNAQVIENVRPLLQSPSPVHEIGQSSMFQHTSSLVAAPNGYLYGYSNRFDHVVQFEPFAQSLLSISIPFQLESFQCQGDGKLMDDCIYQILIGTQETEGKFCILKIDTRNMSLCKIDLDIVDRSEWLELIQSQPFHSPFVANDGCICWQIGAHLFRYNINSQHFVFEWIDAFGEWCSGVQSEDGIIYCVPYYGDKLLTIDPFSGFIQNLIDSSGLSQQDQNCILEKPIFDEAAKAFGFEKTRQAIQRFFPIADQVCPLTNLHSFMIAASAEQCSLDIIYFLLKRNPSLLFCHEDYASSDRTSRIIIQNGKKRKAEYHLDSIQSFV